jgi:hypothetical protein
MSGPHDFAVRLNAVRYRRIRVHRIPPRGRDDRVSPLSVGRDGESHRLIWVSEKQKYFFQWDWTGQITLIRLNKFDFTRKRHSPDEGNGSRMRAR